MPALNNALKDHASKNHGLPKFHIFSKRKAFFSWKPWKWFLIFRSDMVKSALRTHNDQEKMAMWIFPYLSFYQLFQWRKYWYHWGVYPHPKGILIQKGEKNYKRKTNNTFWIKQTGFGYIFPCIYKGFLLVFLTDN